MDSKRIFISGLPFETTSEGLAAMFKDFGTPTSAFVVKDRDGRSRGFGFVEMTTGAETDKAIAALNNTVFDGRNITVQVARPKPEPTRDGGGRSGSFNH